MGWNDVLISSLPCFLFILLRCVSVLVEAGVRYYRFSVWMKWQCSIPFRKSAHLLTHRSRLGFSYSLLSWTNPWTTANVTLLCLPASYWQELVQPATIQHPPDTLVQTVLLLLAPQNHAGTSLFQGLFDSGLYHQLKDCSPPPGLGINGPCMCSSVLGMWPAAVHAGKMEMCKKQH